MQLQRPTRLLMAITLFASMALAASAEMRVTHDIAYAERAGADPNATSLDVYAPAEGSSGHPALIYIHGGGWRTGDKANVGSKAQAFTDAGYVFVSVNYRLSPAIQHPAHIQDIAAAVAWVHENAASHGGDPNRIFVIGHSAGAHLAALVGTDARRLRAEGLGLDVIKGVISLDSAAYDIPRKLREFGGPRAEQIFTSAFSEDTKTREDASPITHVKQGATYPAFLLIHAGNRAASREISIDFANTVQNVGATAEVFAAPDRNHATLNRDLGQKGDHVTERILRFLDEVTGSIPDVE
ncbi:MAG: alpha/beta hydrolase [bacterium]|nr:alpha/beta hydrolase [bacterium]